MRKPNACHWKFFAAALLATTLTQAGSAQTTSQASRKKIYRPIPPPKNFSPPILQIDEAVFDVGSVLQGEPIKHDFVIFNAGGAPLTVTQVRTSCGCTAFTKPTKPVLPNEKAIIGLEIDTKRFKGPIKKTADVYSNASSGSMKLTLGGTVEPFFEVDPPSPRITKVRKVDDPPTKVTIRRSAQKPFYVKGVETQSQILTAKLTEVQPGELYEVLLSADLGDDPKKFFYEKLDLKVSVDNKDFDYPMNVSINVKDRIDIQPRASIYFSKNDTAALKQPGAAPVTKEVELKSLAGPDYKFEITKVEMQTQTFESKVETVEPGKHYRLIVSLSKLPDTRVRTVREKIVVETNDPTVKELNVSVLAAVQ